MSWADFSGKKSPTACPILGCNDTILGKVTDSLAKLLAEKKKQRKPTRKELELIDEEICAQIAWDNKQEHLHSLGRQSGLPVSLDFSHLVSQVLLLKDDIIELATDGYVLHNCVLWDDFLDSIDHKIFRFGVQFPHSNKGFEYAAPHARCG